jgi:hypothetical protein
MSDEQGEQLYGREGTEQSQGYSKMPLADAPVEDSAGDFDRALNDLVESRPDPAPVVERAFFDVENGEPRDPRETVSAEDAARQLSNIRQRETEAVEQQRLDDFRNEIDADRGQLQAERLFNAVQNEQQLQQTPQDATGQDPQQPTAQPEYQPQPESVQQATDPQYDADLVQALQDPKVRGILERVSQGVEQTAAQFQQQLADASLTAATAFLASFPELAGLRADQLAGAVALINQTNPARAQEIARHYGRVNDLVQQTQKVAHAAQEQQQTRAAEQFRAYAAAHDAVSLRNETPESVKAIQSVILEDARRAGISEKDIAQVYNSVPAFRHSFVQDLLADGAKYRLAQRNVARAAHRQVPHVARPGSSAEALTRTEEALASARSKLKPSMNPREAADYLIARRGAKR